MCACGYFGLLETNGVCYFCQSADQDDLIDYLVDYYGNHDGNRVVKIIHYSKLNCEKFAEVYTDEIIEKIKSARYDVFCEISHKIADEYHDGLSEFCQKCKNEEPLAYINLKWNTTKIWTKHF